jgi:glutathione peroxidase
MAAQPLPKALPMKSIAAARLCVLPVLALLLLGQPALAQSAAPAAPPAAACPALLQYTVPRLQDDKPQPLCQYAGKVLLVVNTASYCGYTPQYEGLEALHAKYAARGLVVLGFPSNDFNQETDDKGKIAELCFNTYGVKFPMFAPGAVKGTAASPFYQALAKATGKVPGWNFNKYLVDRKGQALAHYGSRVEPTSAELTAAVEKALAAN